MRPILGDITPNLGQCMAAAGATGCGAPVLWHVIWTPTVENSLLCERHMGDAANFDFVEAHRIGPDCAMPGASFVSDDPICRVITDTDFLRLGRN